MSRFIREGQGWNSHLNSTKRFIVDALCDLKPQSVRILGSGWLLDAPMEELLSCCQKIILVDIAHPAQILHRYEQNPKVVFETTDLNNLTEYLFSTPAKSLNFFAVSNQISHSKKPIYTEDLVISLNILSQLNDYPIPVLAKRLKLSQLQADELSKQIQANHLNSLPKGKSVLITDYEEEYDDEDGAFLGASPTVFVDIERGKPAQEWEWYFDTHFIYREDCQTTLKVLAVRL